METSDEVEEELEAVVSIVMDEIEIHRNPNDIEVQIKISPLNLFSISTICRSPPYAAAQSLSALSSHSKSCTLNQLTEHTNIVMLFRSSLFTDHPIFMTQ